MTSEFRVFEVDKYGNKWFEISFAGNYEIQKRNAENYVKAHETDTQKYVIEEV